LEKELLKKQTVNKLDSNSIPDPKNLRSLIFSTKGQALVATIGPDGKLFTLYPLNENTGGTTY
jgi:hypothetical protein